MSRRRSGPARCADRAGARLRRALFGRGADHCHVPAREPAEARPRIRRDRHRRRMRRRRCEDDQGAGRRHRRRQRPGVRRRRRPVHGPGPCTPPARAGTSASSAFPATSPSTVRSCSSSSPEPIHRSRGRGAGAVHDESGPGDPEGGVRHPIQDQFTSGGAGMQQVGELPDDGDEVEEQFAPPGMPLRGRCSLWGVWGAAERFIRRRRGCASRVRGGRRRG